MGCWWSCNRSQIPEFCHVVSGALRDLRPFADNAGYGAHSDYERLQICVGDASCSDAGSAAAVHCHALPRVHHRAAAEPPARAASGPGAGGLLPRRHRVQPCHLHCSGQCGALGGFDDYFHVSSSNYDPSPDTDFGRVSGPRGRHGHRALHSADGCVADCFGGISQPLFPRPSHCDQAVVPGVCSRLGSTHMFIGCGNQLGRYFVLWIVAGGCSRAPARRGLPVGLLPLQTCRIQQRHQ
mmetsp:Transcript_24200/g.33313  ORF Transcript_24200/g.33313 Transcript_24200/m.33313 type:complete len:239 (-) Transcript_24200:318-1034(-)